MCAPLVARRAVAHVARVRVLLDHAHQFRPLAHRIHTGRSVRHSEAVGHLPRARLVDKHERCVEHEPRVHADVERHLQRLDRVVAAVWVAL